MTHEIVPREDWLSAHKALFEKERAMTHAALDTPRAKRRALPWVRVDKDYLFERPDGACTLADLFDGHSQLAIYPFMLTPSSEHLSPGCSYTMDHANAARRHFEHADLAFAAPAPIEWIEVVRARMGWSFPWVSSGEGDFNHDFGVSFTRRIARLPPPSTITG